MVARWLKRLICELDEHKPPAAWDIRLHDPMVTCARCGKPFDAAEQERLGTDMQTW